MEIRLAKQNDIEKLNILFKEVIKDMAKNKIYMWNEIYPFCEFETDILNKSLYIIEDENEIIGSFVLSDKNDPDFENIMWKCNENWISINRLAILPQKQGKGYAKKAMEYIEDKSITNGYDSIRLTVYEKNKSAIALYEKYGYERVVNGTYYINEMMFVGYEKNIK